ncbi:hypothetical protein HanPSC8_Chr08g0313541 [Helianthus annuus]|nr:hypothetical protein HanPSC8_Chr08g0313541 [Helianthus annuus]
MNTTREENQHFSTVTSIIQLSKAEVVEPGALSTKIIQQHSLTTTGSNPNTTWFCCLLLFNILLRKFRAQCDNIRRPSKDFPGPVEINLSWDIRSVWETRGDSWGFRVLVLGSK